MRPLFYKTKFQTWREQLAQGEGPFFWIGTAILTAMIYLFVWLSMMLWG